MDISFNTAPGNLRRDIGFGVAGFNMVRSLQKLGHTVPYDDPRSQVQINFSQPEWFHLRDHQYQIGFTPWESSQLPESWPGTLNKCDEVWTPSEKGKEWFISGGVTRPIKVYKHGIEEIWTPYKRDRKDVLQFLHVGEPAPRKGGQIAFDAFRAAFGDQQDVHLTIKAFAESRVKGTGVSNVSLFTKVVPIEHLPQFFHSFDVLIYPSFGEGFGLIPLQAVATGMPTVTTTWWCPYPEYVLPLDYRVVDSPWPYEHPGQVSEPDFDNLVYWYREIYENFEARSAVAFAAADKVRDEYDWVKLTEKAFEDIAKKFS